MDFYNYITEQELVSELDELLIPKLEPLVCHKGGWFRKIIKLLGNFHYYLRI